MPRGRKAGPAYGPNLREVSGSVFAPTENHCPTLPRDLSALEKKAVKLVYDQNPQLEHVHLPLTIRLVKYRRLAANLVRTLETEGPVVALTNGNLAKHPAISALAALEGRIQSLERALAITVQTRNEQVPKSERVTPEETKPTAKLLKLA